MGGGKQLQSTLPQKAEFCCRVWIPHPQPPELSRWDGGSAHGAAPELFKQHYGINIIYKMVQI